MMEEFCKGEFWNNTLTWNTTNPDFTPCFEKTVLVWVPCMFLWIFAPLETHYILKSKDRNIPWSFLNISKIVLSLVLIINQCVLLFSNFSKEGGASGADYLASCLLTLSFILQLFFVALGRKRGIQSSGYLFMFWFFLLIFMIPAYKTHFIYANKRDAPTIGFITYMIYFPLILVMFFLNCFCDKRPKTLNNPRGKKASPELDSSFLSRITFSWMDPLIWKGYRSSLVQDNLWDLTYDNSSSKVVKDWDRNWNKSLNKAYKEGESHTRATFSELGNNVSVVGLSGRNKHYTSMLPTMLKTFGLEFAFGSFMKLFHDVLQFTSPLILRFLINFAQTPEAPEWHGYLFAVLLYAVTQFQSLLLGQYFVRMFLVGLKIRTAIISAVYRKAMRISSSARKDSTVGEIVNLMSVDAQRFMDLTTYLNMLWSAPLQIALALYFLWQILGPSVLAGLAIMIILIPVNGFIANKVKRLQISQMKQKDERVKLMSEILNGIKVLKLYAWEPSFEEQVQGVRRKEIKVLRQAAYLNAGTSFLWTCTPFMVSLATFAVYVSIEGNHLDSTTAFVSISLFNLLRFPIAMLPMMITNMVQASVSLKRMNRFLNGDELDPHAVSNDTTESRPIVIENGTFAWGHDDDDKDILRSIDMKCAKGSLVGVVGTVGAGKSSLCSAMLGEMERRSGRVNIKGSIAYVPQQAWIQNATLRDNITFGKSLDEGRYKHVIETCALEPDFAMLPAGDQTEIGEKGINLSGGQKQRVSLARAVYYDSDIYLLDDPLSAVDSHVGKHLFERVIGPEGVLRKKTRILVTHGLTYLKQMDHIIVLKNGAISEQGTYEELIQRKGEFQEFLLQYLTADQEDADEEDLDEIKAELEKSLGRHVVERQISRRREESESSIGGKSESLSPDGDTGSLRRRKLKNVSESEKENALKPVKDLKEDVKGKKLIEAEKSETGRVSIGVYSYYIRAIGVLATVATIFFYGASNGFSVGSNIWLAKWSEDVNATEPATRDMYLGVYGALGIGQAFAILIGAYTCYYGCFMAAVILHNNILNNVLHLPMEFFDTNPIGRVLNRFSKDIDTLDNTLPWNLRSWLMCIGQVLSTFIVIIYATPMFAVVMLPTMILYYFVQVLYVQNSRQLKRIESVSRSPIYSHFGESIQGASTIRAYGKEQEFIIDSEDRVDFNQVSYYPSVIANRWLAIRLEFVGNVLTFFAALFAVIGRDNISGGDVGLSISYALSVTQTLNWLVRMTSDVETNVVAVERVKEYTEVPTEAAWEVASKKPSKSWPTDGLVQFNKYSTRYREGLDLVVKGIDCQINPMEKVGIVGRTGAGKSSLTLGLFRIIEAAEGNITIDGIDIGKLGLHDVRGRLTIIPQDPVLFSGSLRMNLDPFGTFSDQAVWDALDHAHLKEFVSELTTKLQHPISEGGNNLSVGQRQLVCLARALLRKTKILVLDEATAAVDLETDELIQATIRREFADCTVLTIAHRLNTIMDSSRVLVLDRGQVQEFDTPAKLLKDKHSIFYGMAKDANLI